MRNALKTTSFIYRKHRSDTLSQKKQKQKQISKSLTRPETTDVDMRVYMRNTSKTTSFKYRKYRSEIQALN